MQKKIIRTMLNADYNEHSHPLFQQLHVLKLQDIYEMEIAKFMYNYNNHNLPSPLLNNFTLNYSIHDHHTRQYMHFRAINCRLNTAFQSILYKGPQIWNSLPDKIRSVNNIPRFIYDLKRMFHENGQFCNWGIKVIHCIIESDSVTCALSSSPFGVKIYVYGCLMYVCHVCVHICICIICMCVHAYASACLRE